MQIVIKKKRSKTILGPSKYIRSNKKAIGLGKVSEKKIQEILNNYLFKAQIC